MTERKKISQSQRDVIRYANRNHPKALTTALFHVAAAHWGAMQHSEGHVRDVAARLHRETHALIDLLGDNELAPVFRRPALFLVAARTARIVINRAR